MGSAPSPLLIPYAGAEPRIASSAWLAPGVVVSGDVSIGADANLWFGVVARGDIACIELGERANIQDGALLHTDPGAPLALGCDVAVGHHAVVHGCTVADDVLIGMGAIVLSRAVIGSGSVIGAGAVVLEDTTVPPRSLVVGCPGRVVRRTEPGRGRQTCRRYLERSRRYFEELESS